MKLAFFVFCIYIHRDVKRLQELYPMAARRCVSPFFCFHPTFKESVNIRTETFLHSIRLLGTIFEGFFKIDSFILIVFKHEHDPKT